MTLVEMALECMKQGSTLEVTKDSYLNAGANVASPKIRRIFLVSPTGTRIPLPLDIFPYMSPHLADAVHEADCTFVYTLHEH